MRWFWIINLILFQASWLAAAFYTDYAEIIITIFISMHFALSHSRYADLKLLILVIPGIIVDALHFYTGTFTTDDNSFPVWLALLWFMFLVSFNHSLHWITDKKFYWISLLGGLGGASSYIGGIKTGALTTTMSMDLVTVILVCSWSLLFPLLILGYRFITLNSHCKGEI